MPLFVGSDCMSAWNMPISQAVPSSITGPSRIASIAFASSMPTRSFAKISAARDVVAERELVLVGDEDVDALGAKRAAQSSMKPRSYGVKSGPAK